MIKKILILFLLIPLLAACVFRSDEYVDFADIEAAKGLSFKVIGQRETDLSRGFPQDCYLPDGTPINTLTDSVIPATLYFNDGETSSPRKTTSTSASSIVQSLLKYGNQNQIIEVVGTYPSLDPHSNPVLLSGKVMLPKKCRPKRMILVSHYTIGSNAEAPSNCFSLEGVLVKLGYGVIIPDYLGYGITADKIHPYLVMLPSAQNIIDMYLAVRPWLKAVGKEPEHDDIYLMGYSQGGALTMAVEYKIETEYSYPETDDYIQIHRVFAGGGPYDIQATFERFITTDVASYPVAIPLVLQGMILGNNLQVKMSDLMKDWLYVKIDAWINSKKYTTGQINSFMGTYATHDMLTKEAMDQTSEKVAELYKAMTINSIASQNWVPKASVYIMHSIDDETVPYTNATNAKSKWSDANIIYNFGHYGGHVMTCLRFIYSVRTLLIEEEEEMKKYE